LVKDCKELTMKSIADEEAEKACGPLWPRDQASIEKIVEILERRRKENTTTTGEMVCFHCRVMDAFEEHLDTAIRHVPNNEYGAKSVPSEDPEDEGIFHQYCDVERYLRDLMLAAGQLIAEYADDDAEKLRHLAARYLAEGEFLSRAGKRKCSPDDDAEDIPIDGDKKN
jgi:hypothetical protein